jgi:hypothetical protein
LHQAAAVDRGDVRIAALEEGLAGDVAGAAVGERGDDAELLLHVREGNGDVFRVDVDTRDAGHVAIEFEALRNPRPDDVVVVRVRLQDHAPLMRDRASALEQHEAPLGVRPIDAAGRMVVGQRAVIEQRVVPA